MQNLILYLNAIGLGLSFIAAVAAIYFGL